MRSSTTDIEFGLSEGRRASCNTTCNIAHQRWPAPTSAESVKTPCFQRSPAPTSARLISDKREVGSSSLPRPIVGMEASAAHTCGGGFAFSACQVLCCQLPLSIEPRDDLIGLPHGRPHALYVHLVVDAAQGLESSARKLLLDFTRPQPEGWVSHAFALHRKPCGRELPE